MTEEEIQDLHERLAYLVDTYGAEASLIALAGYASARSGRHYEVVELPPTNGSGEGGDRDARLAGDVPVSDRNEFIFAVRADQQLTTAEAMVALVIASYADLDGSNCFTAYETIAKGAKVSVRSAKRHVQTLKRYGLLDYTSGAGRGSNRYVLKVPEVPSQDVVPTIGTTRQDGAVAASAACPVVGGEWSAPTHLSWVAGVGPVEPHTEVADHVRLYDDGNGRAGRSRAVDSPRGGPG
jgi:hypothetical protein